MQKLLEDESCKRKTLTVVNIHLNTLLNSKAFKFSRAMCFCGRFFLSYRCCGTAIDSGFSLAEVEGFSGGGKEKTSNVQSRTKDLWISAHDSGLRSGMIVESILTQIQ